MRLKTREKFHTKFTSKQLQSYTNSNREGIWTWKRHPICLTRASFFCFSLKLHFRQLFVYKNAFWLDDKVRNIKRNIPIWVTFDNDCREFNEIVMGTAQKCISRIFEWPIWNQFVAQLSRHTYFSTVFKLLKDPN